MRQIKLTEETKKDILTTLLKRSPSQYPEYEKPYLKFLIMSEITVIKLYLNIQKNLTDINMMKIL